MLKKKKLRTRGKISFSRYFQSFEEGDRVSIVMEHSQNPKFPKRIQGTTGVVEGQRGQAYIIKIKEGNKEKTHIIKPVHLKKIK